MLSPLRYPGGKSDLLSIALRIFKDAGFEGRPVIEPFAGSAAVSLGLLDFGLTPKVTLVERDPLLFSFWHSVFNDPAELIVRFQALPISLETWENFQPFLKIDKPTPSQYVELGVAALFFNRANFSGILAAGPIGGRGQKSQYKIGCRTNKDDLISRILAIASFSEKVDVVLGDAVTTIKSMGKRKNLFFYLDPPYYNKGELLYRHFYKLKQHKELATALADVKFDWLLSYDSHHVIEFLYEEFQVSRQAFRYSVHSPKNDEELLISSFPLDLSWADAVMPRRQRHWPTRGADDERLRSQISLG